MVTFGLDVPAAPPSTWKGDPLAFYARVAETATAAGFSRLWVGDHALWHRPRFESIALLSVLAATSDLCLGTGILLAPLRHPVWIAKSAATLDQFTGGRFILGLGVGGEYQIEFDVMGVDASRRGALTDETIRICRAAWSGHLHETFSPLPANGDIPIWVGGRAEAALRRAGALADGYLGLFLTPSRFRSAMETVAHHRRGADRPGDPTAAMALWTACDADDRARALRHASRLIATEYALPEDRFHRYLAAGTPDDLAGMMGHYVDAGAEHLLLHIAHPDVLAQTALLGAEVLPRFR